MNPAPTPLVIEYVNGMSPMVRNAGSAMVKSPKSMLRTCAIISTPTTTSAGAAASDGTNCASGDRKIVTTNSSPVAMLARPVRAPSPMPDADSTYVVADDAPATPPAIAATPSTSRTSWMRGSVPSLRSRPASDARPIVVPITSKKSDSTSENTTIKAEMIPAAEKPPNSEKSPNTPKSGAPKCLPENVGTLSAHASGLTTLPVASVCEPMSSAASRMTASTVAATMPIRIAPLILRAYSTPMSSRPTTNTNVSHPLRWPSMPMSTGVPAPRRTKPASTRPISAMNRPIPAAIALLSSAGMARNTATRNPVSTRNVMTAPSSTTRPIAADHDILLATWNATNAFRPSPVANANG